MTDTESAAILVSGGLDSAILLGEMLREFGAVHPLYVRHGYVWEERELACLRSYLDAVRAPSLRPLVVLDAPLTDLMRDHWSMTGRDVPDGRSADEAVYLPARNLLLLTKAVMWCQRRGVGSVALATLKSNPFSDATPAFFAAFAEVARLGLGAETAVRRPYAELSKTEVMRRGKGLPLERTFSCLRPLDGRHCGACNKCAERRAAFRDAGLNDPTSYHHHQGGLVDLDQPPPA